MAAPEPFRPPAWPAAALAAVVLVATACAGPTPPPAPLPPLAVGQPRPEATPAPPPPAPAPTPAATTIVIEAAEDEPGASESLGEAARRERERRRAADKPVAVITNQNLAEYAKGQKLTTASAPAEEPGPAATAEPGQAQDESYWRERGLEIRRRWRSALEDVERLEGESAELRRRFYAADDPYVRDNQIKPEWDHLLAELDRARQALEAAPKELDAFLEEGRRAGVLPGWLREGIELEPEPAPPAPDSNDPREPVVIDQDPGQP